MKLFEHERGIVLLLDNAVSVERNQRMTALTVLSLILPFVRAIIRQGTLP